MHQALAARQEGLRAAKKRGEQVGDWLKSLAAHGARLRWRSHFGQKLHDEPRIEHENMCRAYDGMRDAFDRGKYDAWLEGRTVAAARLKPRTGR